MIKMFSGVKHLFQIAFQKNFDVDVKEYSDYLEEAYRLCPACNDNICSEVYRQDADIRSKLLGQRLHQSVLPDTKVCRLKGRGKYSLVVHKK